mgnify:FL=1
MKNNLKHNSINDSESDRLKSALVSCIMKRYTMIEQSDLYYLVKVALEHKEISSSKASNLLGLPLEDLRVLQNEWFGNDNCADLQVPPGYPIP